MQNMGSKIAQKVLGEIKTSGNLRERREKITAAVVGRTALQGL